MAQLTLASLSKLFGVLFFILGLTCLFGGYMSGRSSLYKDHGITAEATVTDLSQTRLNLHTSAGGSSGDMYFNTVKVKFTTLSGETRADVGIINVHDDFYKTINKDSVIKVVYTPEEEKHAMLPEEVNLEIAQSPGFYIAGVILMFAGLALYNLAKIRTKLGR